MDAETAVDGDDVVPGRERCVDDGAREEAGGAQDEEVHRASVHGSGAGVERAGSG